MSIQRVQGPDLLSPGTVARYALVEQFPDGTVRDVANVTWTSSDESVLAITSDGLATGRRPGEVTVKSLIATRASLSRTVLVLTPGTSRVAGWVQDGDASVSGARVEVVTSSAAGLRTTTEWSGQYVLIGVPPDAEIQVTKDGFQGAIASVGSATGTTERRSLHFKLDRLRARADFSGTYTLDITASCAPNSWLPDGLRHRRYTATLTQDARANVQLKLSGADFTIFFPFGNVGSPIFGTAREDQILFRLEDSWEWGVNASLMEQLPDGTALVIDGSALTTASSSGLSGSLVGSFSVYPSANNWSPYATCKSDAHVFTLSR